MDKITNFKKSLIQHGILNNRIYLMKLSAEDMPLILEDIEELAITNQYTKIFAKVPVCFEPDFIEKNYIIEASIPDFFLDNSKCVFMSKFFDKNRQKETNKDEIEKIKKIALGKSQLDPRIRGDDKKFSGDDKKFSGDDKKLNSNRLIKKVESKDILVLTKLYKKVFPSYPFPITEPSYIKETMKTHVDYYAIYENKKIIAAGSLEKDMKNRNAELTDFATDPLHRSKGLASALLKHMEKQARKGKIKTTYTIARALSYGINITFGKFGYKFAGTLINNTNISGKIESMNVWYKNKL